MGTSRGAYEGPDYHQKEEDRFALEAAQRLELLADQDEQRLILVAAPRVLGVIRAHISPTTQQSTLSMIAKDYTDRDPRDIAEMLVRHAN